MTEVGRTPLLNQGGREKYWEKGNRENMKNPGNKGWYPLGGPTRRQKEGKGWEGHRHRQGGY